MAKFPILEHGDVSSMLRIWGHDRKLRRGFVQSCGQFVASGTQIYRMAHRETVKTGTGRVSEVEINTKMWPIGWTRKSGTLCYVFWSDTCRNSQSNAISKGSWLLYDFQEPIGHWKSWVIFGGLMFFFSYKLTANYYCSPVCCARWQVSTVSLKYL